MSTQQVMSRIARNLWRRGETITGSDLQNGEPGGSKQEKTKSKRQIRTSDIKRNKRRRKGKAIEGETRGTEAGTVHVKGTTIRWKTISPTDRDRPRKLKKPKALQR